MTAAIRAAAGMSGAVAAPSGDYEDRWDPTGVTTPFQIVGSTSTPWDGGQSFVWTQDTGNPDNDPKWTLQDIYDGVAPATDVGGGCVLHTPAIGPKLFVECEFRTQTGNSFGPMVASTFGTGQLFYAYAQQPTRIRIRARDQGSNVNVVNVDHGTTYPCHFRMEMELIATTWNVRGVVSTLDFGQSWEATDTYVFAGANPGPYHAGMYAGSGEDTVQAFQKFKAGVY